MPLWDPSSTTTLLLLLVGLTTTTTTATLLWWWWWASSGRRSGHSLPLPPGPGPALPLLGHLHLLARRDPRASFREWRARYGDVFSLYLGRQLVVVLNGYRVIRQALVTQGDVFSDRPHLPFLEMVSKSRGVINTSGELWKDQRRTAMRILRDLGMGRNVLADKVQHEVLTFAKAILDKVKAGQDCQDLERLTHLSVANNICSVVFGKRYDYDDPEFHKQLDVLEGYVKAGGVSALSFLCPALRFLPGDVFRIKQKASLYRQLRDDFVQPILNHHFHNHHHQHHNHHHHHDDHHHDHSPDNFIAAYIDVIHSLKNDKIKEHVNENNLQRLVLELFGGGTDTTSTTLLWGLAYLLHHPHVQDRCHEEVLSVVGPGRPPTMADKARLPYVEATLLETLRFAGTSPLAFPHSVPCDVSFEGYVIPKGTFVLVYLDTALRDPQVWKDPDTFRPERFLDEEGRVVRREELIPFGTGKRSCLGESLARTELFLYLSTLIQRFHFLPPEDGQLPSLEGIMGITKFPHPFKVRIVPREVQY
ncbi:cytochrome P450 2B4-like [Babylonia areolata]|uniref:cytochrome P450 2B4-like n=1 Tax=Babylonia areolata TaxID=304850 RepID=UPI003FD60114